MKKNGVGVLSSKPTMDSKTLPDSTTCSFLAEGNGGALKTGQSLSGKVFHEKQVIPNNAGNTLQVSANTGTGNGLLNEMFPDDLFETDVHVNGVTEFHIQSDGCMSNSYTNIQRQPQVCRYVICRLIYLQVKV